MVTTLILSLWLTIGIMLIGGINSAIAGFEVGDVSQGVWGIIRAVFSEIGMIPFYIGWIIGWGLITNEF